MSTYIVFWVLLARWSVDLKKKKKNKSYQGQCLMRLFAKMKLDGWDGGGREVL